MPRTIADVTPADLLQALELLGHPAVFYHPHRDEPDGLDVPQLLGAITSAAERLVIARQAAADHDTARCWAAGWLQVAGADRGECGAQQAFELITVRLQQTARLLEGYDASGDVAVLVRSCLAAAASYATVGAVAAGSAAWPGEPQERIAATAKLVARRMGEAAEALGTAVEVSQRVAVRAADTAGGQ